ncbi:MAG: co-chaperone GroES [Candidatus Berkelbacteria bacterium]|nr:co-chaperone GroES [Candidatus Berkelbacteria bacterium]
MLKPLADRLLVKPILSEDKTKSGIYLPDSAKEQRAEGEVVALGTGLKEGKKYEFSVKVGDKIVYSKYAGDEIKIEGIDYKVMKEEEVLGILS